MDTIFIAASVTLLLILLLLLARNGRRRHRAPTASVRPHPVLDGNQRRLYRTLKAGLPHHHVLARVPFAAFLAPRNSGERQPLPLETQLADFVICDSEFRVVAVVEADGGEHRSERDALLRDAALPQVHWSADALPDASEVRETIQDLESLHAISIRAATGGESGEDMDARDRAAHRAAGNPGTRREPRL